MIRALTLLVVFLFCPALQAARGQDALKLFERMEGQIHKAKTLQLDYDLLITQTSGSADPQSRKGQLVVARADKVRFTVAGRLLGKEVKSLLVSDGKRLFSGGFSSTKPPEERDTPKQLDRTALLALSRHGIWLALITGTHMEGFVVSELRPGKKDSLDGKEAQAVHYKMKDTSGLKQGELDVTLWIDTKTLLPLKRVSTSREGKNRIFITENYTSVKLDGPIAAGTFELPKADARAEGKVFLKNIGVAMSKHLEATGRLPAAAICDKDRLPLLSWRVALLPYMDEGKLYKEFKLDEPWDSEHNKKLIPRMPRFYQVPGAPKKVGEGETFYRVLVAGMPGDPPAGDGTAFEWSLGLRLLDFTDGTSATLSVVEAAQSVPWTSPDELGYDAKKPLPKFANFAGNGTFLALFVDGSVRTLRSNLPEATLRALITRAAGDIPGDLD